MSQQETAIQIALGSIGIGSIEVNATHPFTWTSKRKSPIYNDNRLALSDAHLRGLICDAFCMKINELQIDNLVIAGTATAGIPWASIVAYMLELSSIYIRGEAKKHGKGKRIEGLRPEQMVGRKVVVIDDLFSTGKSAADAAQAVIDAGADVVKIVSIFTYEFSEVAKMFNGELAFNEDGDKLTVPCLYDSLLGYTLLLKTLSESEKNPFSENQIELLGKWSKDPKKWDEEWVASHPEPETV